MEAPGLRLGDDTSKVLKEIESGMQQGIEQGEQKI